jgi:hypothetical protein
MTQELRESKERLNNLNDAFNLCDPEFSDIIIFELLAEECRYNSLLKVARRRNVC